MRHIDEIIVHCSATKPEWMDGRDVDAKVAEIKRWHVEERGWRDIGYHVIIDRDGSVMDGRPISQAGAHVRGRNANSIGICLIGGHGSDANDAPGEHFTATQLNALRTHIDYLRSHHHGIKKVSGHNEYAAKACPGFRVGPWLAEKTQRTSKAQSTTLQATAAAGVSGAGGVATAISALDGTAQLVVIGAAVIAALALAWIARERIRKWARGDR